MKFFVHCLCTLLVCLTLTGCSQKPDVYMVSFEKENGYWQEAGVRYEVDSYGRRVNKIVDSAIIKSGRKSYWVRDGTATYSRSFVIKAQRSTGKTWKEYLD